MKKRNYRREYALYYGKIGTVTKKQWQRRMEKSKRNITRKKFERAGVVSRFDGMDIDHKDHNPLNNHHRNLRVVHRSQNRARNHD